MRIAHKNHRPLHFRQPLTTPRPLLCSGRGHFIPNSSEHMGERTCSASPSHANYPPKHKPKRRESHHGLSTNIKGEKRAQQGVLQPLPQSARFSVSSPQKANGSYILLYPGPEVVRRSESTQRIGTKANPFGSLQQDEDSLSGKGQELRCGSDGREWCGGLIGRSLFF